MAVLRNKETNTNNLNKKVSYDFMGTRTCQGKKDIIFGALQKDGILTSMYSNSHS